MKTPDCNKWIDNDEWQERWLSLPGSRLVLNPFDFDSPENYGASQLSCNDLNTVSLNLGYLDPWLSECRGVEKKNILMLLERAQGKDLNCGWKAFDDVQLSWQAHKLPFDASDSDGIKMTGCDFLYSDTTVMRRIVPEGYGEILIAGAYTGKCIAGHPILIHDGHMKYAVSCGSDIPEVKYFRTMDELMDGGLGSSEPFLDNGIFCFVCNVSPGESVQIALDFDSDMVSDQIIKDRSLMVARSKDADEVLDRTAEFWNRYLLSVPNISNQWEFKHTDSLGVSDKDIAEMYYKGWIFLLAGVLPPNPETGFLFPQLPAGKPSLWGYGDPKASYTAAWDSIYGIHMLAFVDIKLAWQIWEGILSLVDDDGMLAGESLPAVRAKTSWILYKQLPDDRLLERTVDALDRNLKWAVQHPFWIYQDSNPIDSTLKDTDFTAAILVDIPYLIKIYRQLNRESEALYWENEYAGFLRSFIEWTFPEDGSFPVQYYQKHADGSVERKAGNPLWVTKALHIKDLPADCMERLRELLFSFYDRDKAFCGCPDVKMEDIQYTIYGLLDNGDFPKAMELIEASVRDIVRSHFFGECYTSDDDPVCWGVRPSLLGFTQLVDCIWLHEGYRYENGDLSFGRDKYSGIIGKHIGQESCCTIDLNGDDWEITGWIRHQWRLTQSREINNKQIPPIQPIPSTVPGAIQADLERAGMIPPVEIGLNSMLSEWVNNREWIYRKKISLSPDLLSIRSMLHFEGLDHSGEIYINGSYVESFNGMHIPIALEIEEKLHEGENEIAVVFYQSPEVDGQYGYSNQILEMKSRFNYTWDWCPRIVPVGIWGNVYLRLYDNASVEYFSPLASLKADASGEITANITIDAANPGAYELSLRVLDNNESVAEFSSAIWLDKGKNHLEQLISIQNVKTWWPVGYGNQDLYTVEVKIAKGGIICDFADKRVGFREVSFIRNPGAPEGAFPYTMIINGKRIFQKGLNWVPLSPFYGAVRKSDYEVILDRFVAMNANLIRVWGGAILETEDFYDLCDELGFLVWQEFPQSSSGLQNSPSEDDRYLELLTKTARVYILRRRHHSSHIIWCGGNELMWDDWKPLDESHAAIQKLKELVRELDPGKHFIPTSPSGPSFDQQEDRFGIGVHHDVHGPWKYLGEPLYYTFFNRDDSLIRTETGCAGISRVSELYRCKGDYNVWPPDERNPYWVHRGAWWIQWKELTEWFGPWEDDESSLPMYVHASRYIQSEALRYAVESTRRREPYASGFAVWMGNEPFPNNSNTSVLEHDGVPKPAYYRLAQAFSSGHASLRYDKIAYKSGETFHGDVYLHSETDDSLNSLNVKKVTVRIVDLYGNELKSFAWEEISELLVKKVGSIDWEIKDNDENLFLIRIELETCSGKKINTYIFTINAPHPFEPFRSLPLAKLAIIRLDDQNSEWAIVNNSDVAAIGVLVSTRDPSNQLNIFPNDLALLPGEVCPLKISGKGCISGSEELEIDGMNIECMNTRQ